MATMSACVELGRMVSQMSFFSSDLEAINKVDVAPRRHSLRTFDKRKGLTHDSPRAAAPTAHAHTPTRHSINCRHSIADRTPFLALWREAVLFALPAVSLVDMAGLVKAKKYDWKDSNLALFGSDTERNVSCQYFCEL